MTSQQENQYQEHTVGWRLYPKETGKPYRQYGKDRKQDQKEAEYDEAYEKEKNPLDVWVWLRKNKAL